MPLIKEVKVLDNYRLELIFDDQIRGIVDLSDLVGTGVFAKWCNYDDFKRIRIGTSGELIWDDEIDLCPDSLYLKVTGKKPEDLFPMLKGGRSHA